MATIHGGQKLAAELAKLAALAARPATLRVGFLEGARYPDGKSVAMIAAINEYGRPPSQPPRPFFRNMIAEKSREWPAAIAGLLRQNNLDAEAALRVAGEAIADQLRESIIKLVSPPLAASTVRRKGFDKPLIDTAVMVNSVAYEVRTS